MIFVLKNGNLVISSNSDQIAMSFETIPSLNHPYTGVYVFSQEVIDNQTILKRNGENEEAGNY